MTEIDSVKLLGTLLFAIAVLHTFLTGAFKSKAATYPEGSVAENLFHFLGEIEVVFGLWAGIFFLSFLALRGTAEAVGYMDGLNFKEPMFVFAIMVVAATKPVMYVARVFIAAISNLLPLRQHHRLFAACLILGPLFGSFITEPAAMTVTALLLRENFYQRTQNKKFMYVTLALLFVNISIGGVLTNFAAPPVLMVANKWQWSTAFMFTTYGWKAVLGIVINTALGLLLCNSELSKIHSSHSRSENFQKIPGWLACLHLVFLGIMVLASHHAVIFLGAFLFFLGVAAITSEYQDELKLKESLLVGFFLAGLVVFGSMQQWWLQELIHRLSEVSVYAGATALTAIVDNAALTYLGAQLTNLSESFKYYLVAGAVVGGGLTVIANAPNPAGYSILQDCFGVEGLKPGKLLIAALPFTVIIFLIFYFQ